MAFGVCRIKTDVLRNVKNGLGLERFPSNEANEKCLQKLYRIVVENVIEKTLNN
jgi:hypothetical protein